MTEFVEAYMEVLTALGDAENDLYSANFAEYAGGGGMKVSHTCLSLRGGIPAEGVPSAMPEAWWHEGRLGRRDERQSSTFPCFGPAR